jgi:two-component system, OmpR family, response regulator
MERVARTRDPERGGYRFEGWQLERRGRRLFDPNATPIALSKGEYALLLAFLEAPQRPLSRIFWWSLCVRAVAGASAAAYS